MYVEFVLIRYGKTPRHENDDHEKFVLTELWKQEIGYTSWPQGEALGSARRQKGAWPRAVTGVLLEGMAEARQA